MASTAPYGTRNPVHGHIGEDVDGSERHRLWRDAQVPNMVPDDLYEAGDDGYWLMSDPSHRRPHVQTIMKDHTEGYRQILSNLMIGKIRRTGEAEMYHFQMDGEYFLGADHGRLVDLGGLGVRFKIYSEQTGGNFAVVEHPIEPGVIVEPHTHQHEDELSYVVSGTIWARVGDKEIRAPAGTYVWKPRQVMHTFWNPGPEPALIVETISPGGFERLFEQVAALLEDQEPGPSTEQDVIKLCNQYGLALDRTWLPELQARFGPMRMV